MSRFSCLARGLLLAHALLPAIAAAAEPLGVKLSPPLPTGTDVSSIQLSPDGSRVVFGVSPGGDLWSVPTTAGGTPTLLHPPDASPSSYARISPDGAWVAFSARFDTSDLFPDIYCAPIDGGELTLLAEDPPNTTYFAFAKDSSRVFFDGDEGPMSVPVIGGPATLLAALGPGQFVRGVSEQPDGSVLFVALECEFDCDLELGRQLVRVPPDGGAPIVLATAAGTQGLVFMGASPETGRVVYSRVESYGPPRALYSIPWSGGPETRLTPPLFSANSRIEWWGVVPDGSRVVYLARVERSEIDVYSVPIEGGSSTRLNTSVSGADPLRSELSPGWGRVVYFADAAFYSVPIAGGPSLQLSPPLLSTPFSLYSPAISRDAHWLLYEGQVTAGVDELFSAPLLGGPAVKLNRSLPPGGDVGWELFTEDSTRVVYTADQETDGVQELWSVPARGGASTKLNAPLVAGRNVTNFLPTSDGLRVVYVADQDQDDVRELYVSPLPPPPAPPRRCGLLGAEAVALVAACEALRGRRRRRG